MPRATLSAPRSAGQLAGSNRATCGYLLDQVFNGHGNSWFPLSAPSGGLLQALFPHLANPLQMPSVLFPA
jgi:hypothetical protein